MEQNAAVKKPAKRRHRRPKNSIFRRGPVYWIAYWNRGKRYQESTADAKVGDDGRDYQKAVAKLGQREAEIKTRVFIGSKAEEITVAGLIQGLRDEYKLKHYTSLEDVEIRWKLHVEPFFGPLKVVEVNTSLIKRYMSDRLDDGAAIATVNREVDLLKGMCSIALENGDIKPGMVPVFPSKPKEDNARKEFLDNADYQKLADECGRVGLWMRTIFEIGYTYGWRLSELVGNLHRKQEPMRVRQVDIKRRTVRLITSKNKKGRIVPIDGILYMLLESSIAGKKPTDCVFTREHDTKHGHTSSVVKVFRNDWKKVCTAAGVPQLKFHDLRRTAARNLSDAGVPDRTIMEMVGWESLGMLKRYDIKNQANMVAAMDTRKRYLDHVLQQSQQQQQLPSSSAAVRTQ